MSAIQISPNLVSKAFAITDVSSAVEWLLDQNTWPGTRPPGSIQGGVNPQFVKIDNIGSATVFVNISNSFLTGVVIPGSETLGNSFPIAPNSSVTIQLIGSNGLENNVFAGQCWIAGATVEGTSILVLTPVQTV